VTGSANPARGEAAIAIKGRTHVLRPSFAALVAAEAELGSLLALVDRASEGQITLGEIATLFWYCLADRGDMAREDVGDAIAALGLARVTPALRIILHQILAGSA
jgi:hypothetical protein